MVFPSKDLARDEGREPERMTSQLNPEKLTLLASAPSLETTEARSSTSSSVEESPAADTKEATVYTYASTKVPAKSFCLTTDYLDKGQLNVTMGMLAKLGLTTQPLVKTQTRTDNYLVYVAIKSKQSIDEILKPLRTAGVHDYFIMRDNGQPKAISLGVFSTREAALSHQQNLNDKSLKHIAIRPFKISMLNKVTLRNLSEHEAKSIRKRLAHVNNAELNDCSNSKP